MLTLRSYQETGLTQLRAALRTQRSVLLCLPCGAGKGLVISVMVHSAVARGKRVIFAVHGLALVNDMSRRLTKLGVRHGILMGGKKREHWHPVQVASIDTLHRMTDRPPADLIIIDEARTFLSATGRKVVDAYPLAKIVGMDATPARLDGKGLGVESGGIFAAMVTGPAEQALIDMGFLVPSIPIGIPDPPDVSKIRKSAGDFNNRELAAACDKTTLVGDIVEHWLKHAAGRKTVAFGVNRAHARHITDKFLAAGIEWAYVDANTPDAEREAVYNRLDDGTLTGISNVMIAGVGWDHPVVSCIIAARPTASLTLWRQMMGRGSRIHPGKKDFVILDHAANVTRHFPFGFFETPPVWTLAGTAPQVPADAPGAPSVTMCKIPVRVPEPGVPKTFTGPLSPDGKWMLGSFHCFRSGPAACPYCGLPLLTAERKVEVKDAALKDLSALRDKARLEVSEETFKIESKRMRDYLDLVKLAKERQYKPNYPAVAFHSTFGYWPPKKWRAEAERVIA